MIKNSTPISMAEVPKYLSGDSSSVTDLQAFIQKFTEFTPDQGEKMKEDLKGLNMLKMKEDHLVKIVDLLPENKEDLNKIFVDVGLDEDEITKILDKVKEHM